MKTITKEKIMECYRKFLSGTNVWDFDDDETRSNIAFYLQGAIDMGENILGEFEKNEH